jgi:hypothetical protein
MLAPREFDFKTLAVGSSVLLAFKELFEGPARLADELREGLTSAASPGPAWVRTRRSKVVKSLLSIPRLAVSAFFFWVMMCSGVLIAMGPERLLRPDPWGTLAEPLTVGERFLYAVILFPTVALYIWRVCVPVWKGWRAVWRATFWLRRSR